MKLRILLYTFLGMSLVACSSDDSFIDEPEEIQKASFKVIGEDASSVFLFSYDGDLETNTTENLTNDIGVEPDYLTVRQLDGLLSFYSFSQGAFSLVQKDLISGVTANFEDFYANGPGRSVVWGINDLDNVFFGYFTPSESRDLAIQNVQLPGLFSEDLTIDFNIESLFQPIQFNQKLFLSYRDALGNYKLTFYDTDSKTVGPIVNFSNTPISLLIDELGDLAVIKNGTNPTIEKYDFSTLSFVNSVELNFNSGFVPGPVNGAVLSGDKLFYAKPFVQPARFAAGPAVFDLITQEDKVIDLNSIMDEVQAEVGGNVLISSQRFSKKENAFLIAYAVGGDEIKGGVVEISTEGELIANIAFPFQPTYILED